MANVRLNKQTYSRLTILEHELYEMARKVERTIDPKLWAAMASLCSRTYKTDLGEFAKPLGNTKDVLLARYVAGLIILKQPCPNSVQEIDEIRALKQYGHKLVDEFNVSIAEIQQLYNENCGNLPKAGSGSYSASAPASAPADEPADEPENDIVSDEYKEVQGQNKHSKNIAKNLKKVNKKSIRDIWDNIMDRAQKTSEDEKQLKKLKNRNTAHAINVSKIDKLKIRRADGTIDEIYPARIARYANFFISAMSQKPETKILKKYFPKSIIWTFEVPTAATDGIRVFFNPAFADRLFSLDSELINKRAKNNPNIDPDEINGTMFQFVLIHEIYHQIYRHMHRIRMKPETSSATSNRAIMDLANISCDVEINRDIEYQLPQFEGCTELLGGMYDKRFTHETWELIFDAYNDPSNNVDPPQQQQQGGKGKNPNPPQGGQGQDQNQDAGNDQQQQDGQGQQQQQQGGQQGNQGQQQQQQGQGGQRQQGNDENYGDDYNDDADNSGGENNQPPLDDKSASYLKGFEDALKKIMSGEIDINSYMGFKTMLGYRTKGALGRKSMGTDTAPENIAASATDVSQTMNVQPDADYEEFNQSEYDQGFADAIKAMKAALNNKNNNSGGKGGMNMPMPNNQGNNGNNDNSNGDNQNNQNNNSNGKDGDQEDIQDDTSGTGTGDDLSNNVQDDSNDVDKTISGEGMEAESADGAFGSDDMITKEQAERMAADAGQPYDADDMTQDPEQKAKQFVNNNRDALNQIGKNNHRPGQGKSMGDVLDHIDSLFKSTVNWRNQLQSFLNGLAKTGRDYEFQRRRIGSHIASLQASKYIKYNEVTFDEKTAVAQVFYLIDNSGSMYCQSRDGGDTVFMQIFSDILHMQKRARIQKSALTYFSYGEIEKSKIRLWDHKTPDSRIKQLIGRNKDDSGGTDICGSINQIYNMGKPYYSKNDPKTLMIVMTDGEDNLSIVKDLPSVVKQNIIFMLLNSENTYLESAQDQLVEAGIKRSRVLLVDTNEIVKK